MCGDVGSQWISVSFKTFCYQFPDTSNLILINQSLRIRMLPSLDRQIFLADVLNQVKCIRPCAKASTVRLSVN